MQADKIIVYRSRQEEAADQFWFDTVIPFVGKHWLLAIICFCTAIGGALALYAIEEIRKAKVKNRW